MLLKKNQINDPNIRLKTMLSKTSKIQDKITEDQMLDILKPNKRLIASLKLKNSLRKLLEKMHLIKILTKAKIKLQKEILKKQDLLKNNKI